MPTNLQGTSKTNFYGREASGSCNARKQMLTNLLHSELRQKCRLSPEKDCRELRSKVAEGWAWGGGSSVRAVGLPWMPKLRFPLLPLLTIWSYQRFRTSNLTYVRISLCILDPLPGTEFCLSNFWLPGSFNFISPPISVVVVFSNLY